jgi:hypothetical protein
VGAAGRRGGGREDRAESHDDGHEGHHRRLGAHCGGRWGFEFWGRCDGMSAVVGACLCAVEVLGAESPRWCARLLRDLCAIFAATKLAFEGRVRVLLRAAWGLMQHSCNTVATHAHSNA